jgi:outer membrane protein TolC
MYVARKTVLENRAITRVLKDEMCFATETSLANSHFPQRRRADIARAVTENQAALQAARQGYSEGAIDFLNIISTQAQLLQSENDLADSSTLIATSLVNLYRALGGGWEVADAASGADRASL